MSETPGRLRANAATLCRSWERLTSVEVAIIEGNMRAAAAEIERLEARLAERQTPTAAAKVIEQADIRLDRGDTLVALLERATERSFQLNRFRPDSQADRDDLTLRSLTAVLKGGRWLGGKFVPDAAAEEEGSQG